MRVNQLLWVRPPVNSRLLVLGSQKLHGFFTALGVGAATRRPFQGSAVCIWVCSPDSSLSWLGQPHRLLLKGTRASSRRGRPPCFGLPAAHLRRLSLFQVSVLGCPDPVVHEIAYQYGKNVGIAFQVGLLLATNVAY